MTTTWRNKYAIAVATLLIPALSHAWGLAGEVYESKNPDLAKLVSVVKKDGRCAFATVPWFRPNAPKVQENIFRRYATAVKCAGDVVLNEGTLQEKRGCAAFILDADNLQTRALFPDAGFNIVENKKCSDGGFEQLVKDHKFGTPRSVEASFLMTSDAYGGEAIVVYSDNPKYLTWYKTAKATDEADTRISLKRHFIEQGSYPSYVSGYQDQNPVEIREIHTGDPLLTSPEGKALADKIYADAMAKKQAELAKMEAQKKAEKAREIASQQKEREELNKKRKKKKEVEALWKE